MRKDKYKGVCKALRWRSLPGLDESAKPLCQHEEEYWSAYLEKRLGKTAAHSFAIGCEILEDELQDDLDGLLALPAGSHIGQLDTSMLVGLLPPQFQMNYDYSFLYRMRCTLKHLQGIAKNGLPLIAHSVLEELIIYLCAEEAESLLKLTARIMMDIRQTGYLICSMIWPSSHFYTRTFIWSPTIASIFSIGLTVNFILIHEKTRLLTFFSESQQPRCVDLFR